MDRVIYILVTLIIAFFIGYTLDLYRKKREWIYLSIAIFNTLQILPFAIKFAFL